MMGIIRLAWVAKGARYEALTLWGKLELRPLQAPFSMDMAASFMPFKKPQMGWGIFHKEKRVGWTKELPDAGHYGVAYITQFVNKLQGDIK